MSIVEDKIRDILESSLYLTMSTVGDNGIPWISPVYTAYDEKYNFYWTSSPLARHSQNIAMNNRISFVVFNSSQAEGTGRGIYFEALVYEMTDMNEINRALKIFYGRKNKDPKPAQDFLGISPRRLYKAVPERAWINDVEKVDGYIIDKRIEIDLI